MRFGAKTSADVPDGWDIRDSLTMTAPDRGANVIFSSDRLEQAMSAQEYAELNGQQLKNQFPDYSEIDVGEFPLGDGHPAVFRQFQWFPEDGEPVTQIQLYLTDSERGYTATATCLVRDFSRYQKTLLGLLAGLAISD